MYLYQVSGFRYGPKSAMSATVVVKDESSSISIELNAQELSELEALGNRVYARHQTALIEKMRKPLETNLLTSQPVDQVEDAVFTEIPAAPGVDF